MYNNIESELLEQKLRSIANRMTLCGSLCYNPGLLNGTFGNIIYLLHYAKYKSNSQYEEYACEFIMDIQNRSNNDISYANGLTGIGIGLEYLLQQSLIEGNSDELLEDFDKILYARIRSKRLNIHIEMKDIIEIGFYFLARIKDKNTTQRSFFIKIIEYILYLLKLHLHTFYVCNPIIVKFLYLVQQQCLHPEATSLLNQQLKYSSNNVDWYRNVLFPWKHTFFYPNNLHIKQLLYDKIWLKLDQIFSQNLNGIYDGNSGKIIWAHLMQHYVSDEERNIVYKQALEVLLLDKKDSWCKYSGFSGLAHSEAGAGLILLSLVDKTCTEWIQLL